MDTTVWKTIPGFPDYQVSDQGEVRSTKFNRMKVLKPSVDGGGYMQVVLRHDGRQATKRVHQLVALAFIGERPEGLQTRHLDGNTLNNASSNLAYGTPAENAADKHIHGTMRTSSGWYRDTFNELIVSLVEEGHTLNTVVEVTGMSRRTAIDKFRQATGKTIREYRKAVAA